MPDRPPGATLKLACACARSFESGYCAIGSAHEAEKHTARLRVGSRDIAGRVSAERTGYLSLAMSFEGSYFAIGSSHEAAKQRCRVVGSCNVPRSVDADRKGSLMRPCACTRSFEGFYLPLASRTKP
jgi:hypothetical protein